MRLAVVDNRKRVHARTRIACTPLVQTQPALMYAGEGKGRREHSATRLSLYAYLAWPLFIK
jgi:hypothetical protein